MQKPMLLMLFTRNTWGMRVTSPWQVVQALGPSALMWRWWGKWAWRASVCTRTYSTGFLSFHACRIFLISFFAELSVPAIARWQPMQVWTDGMPGSAETATE